VSSPFHKFLGAVDDIDPYRLLALPPGETPRAAVEQALAAQLARVDRHPEAAGAEAALVRARLHDAAAFILRGAVSPVPPLVQPAGNTVQPLIAAMPPGAGASARSSMPGARRAGLRLDLTPFDRSVLAMLVACGGWNAASRAKLVALASIHGVSPAGLMRVVSGLARLASTGGTRVEVAQITQGAGRFSPDGAGFAESLVAVPGEDRADLAASLLPELKHGGTWATIKLSLLFGAITLMLGTWLVRLLIAPAVLEPSIAPPPSARDQALRGDDAGIAQPPESPAVPVEDRAAVPPAWPDPPTFAGSLRVSAATEALDQSPRLPELLDELARKLIIAPDAAPIHYRDWSLALDQAGACWPLADRAVFDAIVENAVEVLFAGADRPAVIEELLARAAAGADRLHEPLDVWRGSWSAGLLAEAARRADAPAALRRGAMERLGAIVGDREELQRPRFNEGAAAYLARAAPRLVARIEFDAETFNAWEIWLAALRLAADGSARDLIILDVAHSILLSSVDLGKPCPSADVLGRLLRETELDRSIAARERTLEILGDPRIDARDAWAFTQLMLLSERAPWMSESLVIAADAEMPQRRDAVLALAERWSKAAGPIAASAAGRAMRVDAELGARWIGLLRRHVADQAMRRSSSDRRVTTQLQHLVLATWLNEAAAALAVDQVAAARSTLDRVERGWASGAPAAPPRGGGGRAIQPGGPIPTGPSTPLAPGGPPGQARGIDGEWAATYEQAGADVEARVAALNALRSLAGGDLGPIDARVLAREVYAAPSPEVRLAAQTLLVELFSRGPNVALEVLDLFPDAPANESTHDVVSRFTGASLPELRSADWRPAATLALVEHAIPLFPTRAAEIDSLAAAFADSHLERAALHGGTERSSSAAAPADAVEATLRALRGEAAGLNAAAPTPDTLAGIERRHRTRHSLAEGAIEQTVASQITALELLAYIVAAEQPANRAAVLNILGECAAQRREASHSIEQATAAELAAARLWAVRFQLDDGQAREGDA
jgi:hypothetical protein